MKTFLEVLTNVRIACAEIGGTITFVFLIAFGMYKAWQEFIVKRFKRKRLLPACARPPRSVAD
jgi:hypothetical protein